ncbi:MAG: hypothetical protein E7603_10045 [Ruminococcaceae bacterium]|nr:hypothetical protein [Oscillospiraceae bacterium]
MNNQTNEQKAKASIKKLKMIGIFTLLLYLVSMAAIIFLVDDFRFGILCIALACIFYIAFISVLNARTISFPLILRLDAPLYYELIKQGKSVNTSAVYQIQAEYFVGHYANVIELCNKKLEDRHVERRWRYYLFSFLANAYFNLGEDEKLREVCNKFYAFLASDRKKEKVLKRFYDFPFFTVFVNGNFEACEQYLKQPKKQTPLQRISLAFWKARVDLCKGETEEAKNGFEKIIAEAPLVTYAELSKKALEAMENGGDYREAVAPLAEAENPAPLQPPAIASFFKVYNKVLNVILIVLVCFLAVVFLISWVLNLDWDPHDKAVEVLLEEDLGEVDMLETFDLEKDDFWVDSMFLCKNTEFILVGSTYYYTDEEYTLYYEIQAQVPLSTLLAEDFRQITNVYDAITEECTVTSAFYANREDVPDENYYLTSFVIEDKTFYFTVTKILFGSEI